MLWSRLTRCFARWTTTTFRSGPTLVAKYLIRLTYRQGQTGIIIERQQDLAKLPNIGKNHVAGRHIHFFTLCKSARVGGTLLFCICLILGKIVCWPSPILWTDPNLSSQ